MPALALGLDDRHDQLGAVDHPAEVDGHGLVPGVEIRIVGRPAAVHPGIVAEHMDAAEGLQRLVHGRLQIAPVSHIGADEGDRIVSRERRPGLVDVRHAPVGDHNLHAFGEKRAHHAEADAVRAAGDERDLPRQILHGDLPSRLIAPASVVAGRHAPPGALG